VGDYIQLVKGRTVMAPKRRDDLDQNLELFPVDVLSVDPSRKGADSVGVVVAVDGYPYTAKSARTRQHLPLNEWLCYHVSEACGIAVPTSKILRMPDGELVFGSRWVGGTYTQTGSINTPDQLIRRVISPGRFWAILALDLFINNLDRRVANLVFSTVDGQTNVLPIDFSRALLHHPVPLPPLSHIPPNCATLQLARYTGGMIRPAFDECDRVVTALSRVKAAHIRQWAQRAPEEWQAVPQLDELLVWWDSEHKDARLQEIKDGLWNGTFI
jgi:hypothetical protein